VARDWEPHVALFAGEHGFEVYERIVASAPRVLRPGGWLVMELGFGTHDYVAGLLAGWNEVRVEPDLAGIPRVIAGGGDRRAAFHQRRVGTSADAAETSLCATSRLDRLWV